VVVHPRECWNEHENEHEQPGRGCGKRAAKRHIDTSRRSGRGHAMRGDVPLARRLSQRRVTGQRWIDGDSMTTNREGLEVRPGCQEPSCRYQQFQEDERKRPSASRWAPMSLDRQAGA
jgi:hypothetical protein